MQEVVVPARFPTFGRVPHVFAGSVKTKTGILLHCSSSLRPSFTYGCCANAWHSLAPKQHILSST